MGGLLSLLPTLGLGLHTVDTKHSPTGLHMLIPGISPP
jgi:hypothetical protein